MLNDDDLQDSFQDSIFFLYIYSLWVHASYLMALNVIYISNESQTFSP